MPPLRVLTLNIAHGAPWRVPMPFLRAPFGLRRALDAIAGVLSREAADVVALQEVDRRCLFSGWVDHVARIADGAGYPHVLHGAHLDVPGCFAQGTALLSRHPLHEPESHAFGEDRAVDKGWVAACVRWRGVAVDLVSVHFDPFSAPRRLRQARRLAQGLEGRPSRPRVVLGDFNSHEGNPGATVEALCQAAGLAVHAPGGGEPTYTTTWPRERLDWILASPALRFVRHARVDAWVSDHFPVVAELDWAPGPQA